ncbi:hypothetical protein SAMN04487995_0522 [Dyadobacter koreensis]|uniref:Uncharacterized protein n=1 Tax=Dyadobacter koreensis TaxID=408657 RepID=A0A1H6QCE6_9BACT|nr:hypothetical protein [Dyadobacter koreensis]SEI41419.1 hypothetical protein SAMN04487995_0522 [Dyadobacter koreensis]
MERPLEKFQSLLPLGYLYLIVLGIMKESLYYYQLNINILKYCSLMDVLISPIAELTSSPIIIYATLFLLAMSLILQTVLTKNSEKEWARKILGLKPTEIDLQKDEIKNIVIQQSIVFLMVALATFFVGIGLSNGEKVAKKIQNNDLSYDYKFNFESDKQEEVFLINSNSSYYFYITKGNKNLKIAPVGSIKTIEVTSSKKNR